MRAQLPVRLLELLDLHLELRARLGHGQPVITGIESTELVDDVEGEQAQDRNRRHDDEAPYGRVCPNDDTGLSFVGTHALESVVRPATSVDREARRL